MDLKKNTADLISERIKERIISGDYSPSQHLVEIKLAKELGVSRHIIRIALDRLQSEGLVRIEPNRGAVVTSLTLEEVIDIITARELLESAVARMAAKQIKPTHIRGLEECLHTMHQAISTAEYDVYSKTNKAFHKIICDASGTRTIPELIDLLRSRLTRLPMRTLLIPGRCNQSLTEHEAILNSLKSKNAEEAETNAKRHMLNLKSAIRSSWNLVRS
jgi:DNA-binding GntR family transcriptional regulator